MSRVRILGVEFSDIFEDEHLGGYFLERCRTVFCLDSPFIVPEQLQP